MSRIPESAIEDLQKGTLLHVSAVQTTVPQLLQPVHVAVAADGSVWGYHLDDYANETGIVAVQLVAA